MVPWPGQGPVRGGGGEADHTPTPGGSCLCGGLGPSRSPCSPHQECMCRIQGIADGSTGACQEMVTARLWQLPGLAQTCSGRERMDGWKDITPSLRLADDGSVTDSQMRGWRYPAHWHCRRGMVSLLGLPVRLNLGHGRCHALLPLSDRLIPGSSQSDKIARQRQMAWQL